jgi:hypothetical protein
MVLRVLAGLIRAAIREMGVIRAARNASKPVGAKAAAMPRIETAFLQDKLDIVILL